TMTPGLVVGSTVESESAILQRAAYRLGIAHSTGYPLHTMLGFVFSRVGEALGANPYSAVTFLSAVGAAIGAAIFYRLAAGLSHPWIGLAAVAVLVVSAQYWHLATITETQALNAITVFGLLWATWCHLRAPRAFYPLAWMVFLAGVGLANHRTVTLTFPAVGVAVLLSGALWRLRPRQWLLLIALGVVPLLSYGYLFIRATDPDVAYGIQPAHWHDPVLTSADMVAHIRGTFSGGGGLEGNLTWPTDDFDERLRYVTGIVADDITPWAAVAALAGGVLMAGRGATTTPEDKLPARRMMALVLAIHAAVWIVFLMSWRLEKAVIYHFALSGAALLGISGGLGVISEWVSRGRTDRTRQGLYGVLGVPLAVLAGVLLQANFSEQDRSDDDRGARYYAAMAQLPQDARVFTGGWSAETFILLEYIQEHNRLDLIPLPGREADEIARSAAVPGGNVYLVPFTRAYLGWYEGALNVQAQDNIALAALPSELLIWALPMHDGRLYEQARNATPVDEPITPEIYLQSYELRPQDDGLGVTLFWHVLPEAEIETAYSVFTHIREYNAQGQPVRWLTGDDNYAPVQNHYPTYLWGPGEMIRDTYFLPCPATDVPRERWRLAFGMTETATGAQMGEYVVPVADIPALAGWACGG
ncbi:MAG: protein O-mannosyl-transferase family, partial [Anaerolineales bacterium]